MKITSTIWFTQAPRPQTIGIVFGIDEITGEAKAYIGTGEGLDEEFDADHISKFGAKFHPAHAESIMDKLGS